MKYLKYSYLILILIIALFTGCKKDFLDLKPIATPTEVSFYKDSTSIDATVTAAYAELCAREVFDKEYFMVIGSIPSDYVDCGGQNLSDYPEAQRMDQFTYTLIDNTATTDIWDYCYKGCRLANTALEKLTLPGIASPGFIKRKSGEVRFMRALYHFMLVQVFGGVPIANKVIEPTDFKNPRNSIKEVFSFIESDLKFASNVLPEKYGADQIGRATKGAAQALMARMLMYESSYAENYTNDVANGDRFKGCIVRYAEAYKYCDSVINMRGYSLVTAAGYRDPIKPSRPNLKPYDGFRWLFTVDGDNSSEGIFEIQNVNDSLGYSFTRGNVMTEYQTCRFVKPGGIRTTGNGWSFNCPTKLLVKAFRNADPRETGLHSTVISPGHESDDPRFATTIGRDGDSIYFNGNLVPMDIGNIPDSMIGRKFECGYDEYWKSVPDNGNTGWTQGPFNVRLIRLGEIVLLAAEAAIKLQDQANALKYVNMIRTRARNSGTTGFPQDLTTVSFEDIVHERSLELACEPYRFFDLVRWNLTSKFINGIQPDNGVLAPFQVTFVPGKHEFWPLPSTQVQLSNGALKQYPAWQ